MVIKRRLRRNEQLTARQHSVLEAIADYFNEYGISPTVRELAERLGVAISAVHRMLGILSEKGYIEHTRGVSRGIRLPGKTQRGRYVPILGNIVAGVPVLSEENYRGSVMLDDAIFPSGELFILQVSGDSMEGADIHNGDFAVIRRQDTADSGDIAAVLIDDEATLKRLVFRDNLLWLLPANPHYKPIVITPTNDDVKILGKLVGLIRRYK